MGFLTFSRKAESQADLLGLQYMYKTGYDPTSFIDFFEKLLADQKRKPGTLSKVFASHPPTGDRITKTQARIDELLPARAQYVVTSSEFLDVQERLAGFTRRTKTQDQTAEDGKPTLRRSPSEETIPVDGDVGDGEEEEDERPTLKRR